MQWTIWCGGLIGQLGAGQLGAGQLGVMDNWVPLLVLRSAILILGKNLFHTH